MYLDYGGALEIDKSDGLDLWRTICGQIYPMNMLDTQ